jgi:hypothetical protein
VFDKAGEIEKNMYPIRIQHGHEERDLSREVARIANLSRQVGARMKAENRDMTKEEAYVQLGHSASLIKAVLHTRSGRSE